MKRNKKGSIVKLMAAALAATTVLGTQTVALAAEATTGANTTATTVAAATQVKDPTKFDLTETWKFFSNRQGSPNPIIVNNGNNVYTIVMYQDQSIILDTINPTIGSALNAEGLYYGPEIINRDDVESIASDSDVLCHGDGNDRYYGINLDNQLLLQGVSVGTTVLNVGLVGGDIFGDYGVLPGYDTLTIAVTVLPAQAGAQSPVYTGLQQYSIKSKQDAANYTYDPNSTKGTTVY
jgi:hypothetical protein